MDTIKYENPCPTCYRKRDTALENEIARLRELVETAFSEGYYAANEVDPYEPHWQESSSRAALEDK